MAIAINHTQSGQNASGTNTITVTSTTGNLSVLSISSNNSSGTVSAVSDNKNTTYTQIGTGVISVSSHAQMFYFPSAVTGATTVTVTFGTSSEYAYQWFDLAGALSVSPLETSTSLSAQGPGANPSGPSVIVTGTADFICSLLCTSTTVTAVASPFTGSFPDPANTGTGFAYDNTTNSGTYSPNWTMTSGTWGGITAAFKAVQTSVPPGWPIPTAGPCFAI